MSKLARVTQKIFGSGAGTDQIAKFGSLFAGSPAFTTDAAQAQSLSNWLTGWFGAAIGGNAPAIEDMNSVCFVLAYQLAYLFQAGIAEWDSATVYYIGSIVQESGVQYTSNIDNNTGNDPASDTVNWSRQSYDPVGSGKDYWGTTLPAGYVWAAGRTLGNASSNAGERANADTLNLFTLFWNNYSNTVLPIQDSTGNPTTRGASAAADFAANKALPVIDMRGRVAAGRSNLGGVESGRLTNLTMSPDGDTLGAVGGAQVHQLITSEIPVHTHTQAAHTHTQNSHTHGERADNSANAVVSATGSGSSVPGQFFTSSGTTDHQVLTDAATATNQNTTATNNNTGGDGSHNTMQPTILCNYILKL